MKIARVSILLIIAAVLAISSAALAAPIESVESARASATFQKVDAFLSEKIVAEQLTAMGVSQEQVHARLAQLSESQLQQLAAQVDLIKAGGTVQGGYPNPLGPVGYMFKQLGVLLQNIYSLLFSWTTLK